MADTAVGAPFAPNNTGLSDTDDYAIGRGALYFQELTAADVPTGGWIFLGNAPAVTATLSKTFKDHFSSITNKRDRDARFVIEDLLDLKWSCEEMNEGVMALWAAATAAAYTNAAVAGFAEYAMVTSVTLGRRYQIVDSNGVRAFGIDSSDLTVEKSGSPDTACVEGTDYTVDEAAGIIHLLSTAVNIATGDQMDVTLAANASAAADVRQIPFGSRSTVNVALLFVGENPLTTRTYELFVPKASVAGEGDLQLISETDLLVVNFNASAVKLTGQYLATLTPLPAGGVT